MKKYEDAISLLTSQGKFKIKLGLERISAILNLMNNPQDRLRCIHVAGTNGKGSVCAILSAVLTEAGYKTGLYISPHVFDYTERISINGQNISKDIFAQMVFNVVDLAAKNDIQLTEFEILTAVMFDYFDKNNVDVVILETGLGGRYDATNVIKENICSVITHIDLDHTERLGCTRDLIAREKAGIIKPECTVITTQGYEIIKDIADELGAMLILISPYEDTTLLSLKGVYQQENLALAMSVIRYAFPKIESYVIEAALQKVKHPCRFEYIPQKDLLIDGAHNPSGIRMLRASLDNYYSGTKKRFIFGCLKNKNYQEMVDILFEPEDEIYFYHFNNPNACTFNELSEACSFPAKEWLEFVPTDKLTVVCGSFYMIKELMDKYFN